MRRRYALLFIARPSSYGEEVRATHAGVGERRVITPGASLDP